MDMFALVLPLLIIGVPIFILVMIARGRAQAERERKEAIYRIYGHTEIAERLISKTIWVGETERQLRDSLGNPHDTDEKVLKTKKKVIWKYQHRGGNRYGLRITVENGAVVGWDEKL